MTLTYSQLIEISTEMNAKLLKRRLTIQREMILVELWDAREDGAPCQTQAELAGATCLSQVTTSRILAWLRLHDLAKRVGIRRSGRPGRDPVEWTITPAGASLIGEDYFEKAAKEIAALRHKAQVEKAGRELKQAERDQTAKTGYDFEAKWWDDSDDGEVVTIDQR